MKLTIVIDDFSTDGTIEILKSEIASLLDMLVFHDGFMLEAMSSNKGMRSVAFM